MRALGVGIMTNPLTVPLSLYRKKPPKPYFNYSGEGLGFRAEGLGFMCTYKWGIVLKSLIQVITRLTLHMTLNPKP